MRVFMTGHEGYIGSVMAPLFIQAGHEVIGLDTGYFAQCTLVPPALEIPTIRKDLRSVELSDLKGCDAVVHLAALSNDPIGNLNTQWTEEINFQGSVRLAELAKAAGIRRFLFSSSCIMYGMSATAVVTEESPLDPKTDYASSKVKAERAIAQLADKGFSPTFLRNGTVYGVSPRMRFDTVLNNLVGAAVTTGTVSLHGDGSPWRPVAHIEDISRAFLHVVEAPIDRVHNQAFNNGENGMNHQILELAHVVADTVPGAAVECLGSPDADQRTYKTDFSKFARTFPDFRFRWNIRTGAQELYQAFKGVGLTPDDFTSQRFTRLKWLRHLLETGRLDASLRWQVEGARV
ncbi:MAG: NAD-dependent dehydratase [Candidatus Omnitrophica bacterium CG11_big_fil_rev_8_21_14_0_20_63_9]|nr:MAG: NAD-dependent dehydratase [Candidatus Omnitrophica bacterium CG11_big_fil_rev_8_21_14_0_20_63_9]